MTHLTAHLLPLVLALSACSAEVPSEASAAAEPEGSTDAVEAASPEPESPPAPPARSAELVMAEANGLVEDFMTEVRSFQQELQAARETGRPINKAHPAVGYFPRMEALAREGSAQARIWCVQFVAYSGKPMSERITLRREMYESIADEQADLPVAAEMVRRLRGEGNPGGLGVDEAVRLYKRLAAKTSQTDVGAQCLFHAANLLSGTGEPGRDESIALYRQLSERFPTTQYGRVAAGQIFQLERLQAGQEAPDFTTEDLEGVEFKLSDYRGKVVVLSFWGFWCGPCRAMLPHEADLVERLADEPFAMIGINTDRDREQMLAKAEEYNVTWRNSFQGGTGGPLVTEWGITRFPAIYVIDHRGVIRFVGPRGGDLERAVAQLITEAKAASPEPMNPKGAPVSVQDDPPLEDYKPAEGEDPELFERWLALHNQYQQALYDFGVARYEAKRDGVREQHWPEHPSIDYRVRYRQLEDLGSARALEWMALNFRNYEPKRDDKIVEARRIYQRLVDEFANDVLLLAAIDEIPDHAKLLGIPRAIEICDQLFDESTIAEIQAQAWESKAELLAMRDKETGERSTAEIRMIWRTLVDGFQGTETAYRAAAKLWPGTERALLKALTGWLEELEELQKKGASPADWPPSPAHDFHNRILPLAETGLMEPVRWDYTFPPPILNADKQGPVYGLVAHSKSISDAYPTTLKDWMDLKFKILGFAGKHFPDHPALHAEVRALKHDVERYNRALVVSTFRPMVESGATPDMRAHAMYYVAIAQSRSPRYADLEESLRLFDAILEDYPQEIIAAKARIGRARFASTMPGHQAPGFSATDQHGLDIVIPGYRGRVLLVDFGAYEIPRWNKELPKLVALNEEHKGKPFAMVSVLTDYDTPKKLHRKARKRGMTWRYTLQFNRTTPLVQNWGITTWPTRVLVGPDGHIVARNLPLEELEPIIDSLLEDLEEQGSR